MTARADRPRVGLLLAGDRTYPSYGAFTRELGRLGYVDGTDIEIDVRFGEGRQERLPELAAELTLRAPKVLAVVGAVSFLAARDLAKGIPLVFSIVLDPVEAGLVPRADSPGGLITGATSFSPHQAREQIRLLKQALPSLSRLAILGDVGVPPLLANQAVSAATAEGLAPSVRLMGGVADLQGIIHDFRREGSGALLVLEVPRTSTHGAEIVRLAHAVGMPTLFGRDLARHGPLLAYGTSLARASAGMAWIVDQILRGRHPGSIPIKWATDTELIVNLRAANELGITIPAEILQRADQVI